MKGNIKSSIEVGIFVAVILIAFLIVVIYESNVERENKHLLWCNEQLESVYRSINQCIIDEQGSYRECFLTDWPEIQSLYSKHRC